MCMVMPGDMFAEEMRLEISDILDETLNNGLNLYDFESTINVLTDALNGIDSVESYDIGDPMPDDDLNLCVSVAVDIKDHNLRFGYVLEQENPRRDDKEYMEKLKIQYDHMMAVL